MDGVDDDDAYKHEPLRDTRLVEQVETRQLLGVVVERKFVHANGALFAVLYSQQTKHIL